jgi:hypothetical protein
VPNPKRPKSSDPHKLTFHTHHTVFRCRCDLLVACDTPDVDPAVFYALNDNSIVYDGRVSVLCESLGDAERSLGDAESSLGDAESSRGDAKSSLSGG